MSNVAFLFNVDSNLVAANGWTYETHHCSTSPQFCDIVFTVRLTCVNNYVWTPQIMILSVVVFQSIWMSESNSSIKVIARGLVEHVKLGTSIKAFHDVVIFPQWLIFLLDAISEV